MGEAWLCRTEKKSSVRPSTISAPTTQRPPFLHRIHQIIQPTMAACERASRPLIQCIQKTCTRGLPGLQLQSTRTFQSTALAREEVQTETQSQPFYKNPDPALVTSPRLERKLLKQGVAPIGSRRRRAALQSSANIPFEQLPYQCFQEARKVLLADREEKIKKITAMREKIARLQAIPTEEPAASKCRSQNCGQWNWNLSVSRSLPISMILSLRRNSKMGKVRVS